MKTAVRVAPVATLVIFFCSMGVASLSGSWVTGGREQVVATGRLTVDDVKGWLTIRRAADGLGIPAAAIMELIDPGDRACLTPTTAFTDIEAVVPGFAPVTCGSSWTLLAAGPVAASPTR